MNSMRDTLMAAVGEMVAVLRPHSDESWDVPSGDVTWPCRATAAHVADDLFSYASQLIAQPAEGYLPTEAVVDSAASNGEILQSVAMCGRLLDLAAAAAAPETRAWHPNGTSDADGFAAMENVEVLVHTYDIAQGLGRAWRPPAALCGPVLARLFPHAPAGEPTAVLLYSCGREALGDLPRQQQWAWDSSVRSERAPES